MALMDNLTKLIVAHAQKLKAEGKPIPKHVQDHLDAHGLRDAPAPAVTIRSYEPGRQALIAALYICGASLTQLAALFECRKQTVSEYVKRKLSPAERIAVRPRGLWRPNLSYERVSELYQFYQDNKRELIGLDPSALASALDHADKDVLEDTDANMG